MEFIITACIEIIIALVVTVIGLLPLFQDWRHRNIWDAWRWRGFNITIVLFCFSVILASYQNYRGWAFKKESDVQYASLKKDLHSIDSSMSKLKAELKASGHTFSGDSIIEPATIMIVKEGSKGVQNNNSKIENQVLGDQQITNNFRGPRKLTNDELNYWIEQVKKNIKEQKKSCVDVMLQEGSNSGAVRNQLIEALRAGGIKTFSSTFSFSEPTKGIEILQNAEKCVEVLIGDVE